MRERITGVKPVFCCAAISRAEDRDMAKNGNVPWNEEDTDQGDQQTERPPHRRKITKRTRCRWACQFVLLIKGIPLQRRRLKRDLLFCFIAIFGDTQLKGLQAIAAGVDPPAFYSYVRGIYDNILFHGYTPFLKRKCIPLAQTK